jgi:hypothetical protein
MKMKNLIQLVSLFMVITLVTGCSNFFGDKTDLDFIEVPDYSASRSAAYVPILPVMDDFVRPTDVCVGFDELIYVVDQGTQEVVVLDQAGRILGRKFVPGATAVAQDRAFDLLVIGTFDTVLVNGGISDNYTFSTIYRISQFAGGGYNLNNAKITNKIVHPFYTGRRGNSLDEVDYVRFNKIAVLANNSDPDLNNQFYVTRQGAGNSGGGLIPNDAVCYFENTDEFISTLNVTTSTGVFSNYFNSPSGITTLAQPPQISARGGRQFLYTSLDETATLKVQLIEHVEAEFASYYTPQLLATGDTSKADGFINSPNKFTQPAAVTIAGDASQYIFVVDQKTDSLYQFTSTGYEGVLPPAATGIKKYQMTSFGGRGVSPTKFNTPSGVAYFDKIVYVADAGNGRVLRFKLTLDFD